MKISINWLMSHYGYIESASEFNAWKYEFNNEGI